jgi:hypothetical protein
MKRQGTLIDTGPIVAILSESDQHHQRCVAELATLRPPLFTCWPVVTEAQWLLRHDSQAVEGLFRAFATKLLALLPIGEEALPQIDAFLRRYRKLKPDMADATLVYLAEREGIGTIFTLDQRDFSVYRYGNARRLKIIPTAHR